MLKTIEGSCLCGEVKVALKVDKIAVGICHCDYCRKLNAGPSFTLNSADTEGFHIHNWEKVKFFSSSENGQRGFCLNCGTYLCFRSKTTNGVRSMQNYFKTISKSSTSQLKSGVRPNPIIMILIMTQKKWTMNSK